MGWGGGGRGTLDKAGLGARQAAHTQTQAGPGALHEEGSGPSQHVSSRSTASVSPTLWAVAWGWGSLATGGPMCQSV